MLTILIGRAGTAKTTMLLDSIQENRSQCDQILLVPEHVSHTAEQSLLAHCGPTISRDAEVLSFQGLARRVLGECGGLADVSLDNGGKILTLRRCLQELAPQLKVFGNPSQRSSFLGQLVALMDEFYAYEVSPRTLYESVADLSGYTGDKLRDVALLFGTYDARLHHSGVDVRSRMQKLRDAVENARYLVGKDLYLDGFSFFNQLEESVLNCALRQCRHVTVTLLGVKGRNDLFQNAVCQRDRLVRMAQKANIPCRIQYCEEIAPTTPLMHLERGFFGSDTPWEQETEEIALYQAGNLFSEVEYVSAQIRRLTQREGYRYRDIVVTTRNMELYGPVITSVFQRDGIAAYISHRTDILDKPVLTLLLSAVDAVTGGFEYEDVFRYLKTGMAGITPEECDLLENYAITWSIRGNMWIRDTTWTANPQGYRGELTPEDREQLENINRIRRKISQPLLFLYEELKSDRTAADCAAALYTFAENIGVPRYLKEKTESLLQNGQGQLAEEYAQIWKIFCGVLDQFVSLLGDTELSGAEFGKLLKLVLTQYQVSTIPATRDQVSVCEMTQNERRRTKITFLLGANDHILPSLSAEKGILDDGDRTLLQERNITLSNATFDALDNELQNIYACLAQPTEQIHISWAATDHTGAVLRPSFVVERIEKLFPQLSVKREDGIYRMTLPSSALAAAGEQGKGAAWQYFKENDAYKDVVAAIEQGRTMPRGTLSPEAVGTLYGKNISMSASRMEKVKTCHFGYFMQYGLKAKERKTAGFEAPEIGTFLHYLLENITRDVMDKGGYGKVDRETRMALIKKYTDQYAQTQIGDYEQKSARFRYLFSRLKKTAYAIIENVAEELENSDFVPLAFELGFGGKDGTLPAISITEGSTTLRINGQVDRVDGWLCDDKLYLRVVDYKTGKKAFDLTELRYGLGIQMLLYLFALQREGEKYFGHKVVPAGVLYTGARAPILSGRPDMTAQEVAAAMQKELKRSGLLLAEPAVLSAMEHSALEAPCYLPVNIKKDGTITGGLASAQQLGKLGQYVEKLLHEIAREVGQGNIKADPCYHDENNNACTYCPYVTACYFSEEKDQRRYMHKTGPEEFWPFVEQEVSHG